MKKLFLDETELADRTELNFRRLCEPYYAIDEVFSPKEYSWPGDKEGRALLSFVSHAAVTGKKTPCMDKLIDAIPEKTNEYFFFGKTDGSTADEQQLSGNSWYLRGLLGYYELYGDSRALLYARSAVEHLYLPIHSMLDRYPSEHINEKGGVSGNRSSEIDGWILSSDTLCTFMSIDGLSHYYSVTKDERVYNLILKMREVFDRTDKVKVKAQTHCSLTAARGFVRMYIVTGNSDFLHSAEAVMNLYTDSGMTYTYQNFNWWGKGNTWTEPCAIVDSLMLSGELFKISKDEKYRILAARIWHNGFAALQVGNGGAGTDTTVSDTEHFLHTKMYEAYFCCTMRLAEGLRYVSENKALFTAETGELKKDIYGRYMSGDIIFCRVDVAPEFEAAIDRTGEVTADGIKLMPLIKFYKYKKEVTDSIVEQVIFSD